jgi:hypothetical protein
MPLDFSHDFASNFSMAKNLGCSYRVLQFFGLGVSPVSHGCHDFVPNFTAGPKNRTTEQTQHICNLISGQTSLGSIYQWEYIEDPKIEVR